MKPSINKVIFPFISALILAACGGSAPEEPVAPAPEPAAPQVVTPAPKTVQKPKVPVKKTAPAPKTTLNADELTARLKQWDKKLATLNTAFEQITSYDGVVISRSHGKLFFQAQGQLLRLDTLNDEETTEQTAVTNKKILRILDASGKEITAMPWAEWVNGQPNKALFDFGHYTALLQAHQATVFESTPQRTVLKLLPKDKSYTLYLLLDGKDFFPQSIIIESDLMKTQADLKQTVKNKPLAKNLFKEVVKK